MLCCYLLIRLSLLIICCLFMIRLYFLLIMEFIVFMRIIIRVMGMLSMGLYNFQEQVRLTLGLLLSFQVWSMARFYRLGLVLSLQICKFIMFIQHLINVQVLTLILQIVVKLYAIINVLSHILNHQILEFVQFVHLLVVNVLLLIQSVPNV